VQRRERVEPKRQRLRRAHRRRQRVPEVPRVNERLFDEAAQPRGGHFLARRIERREICRRGRAVQVIRLDVELVPAQLAPEPQPRPGLQLVGKPRLVEPDCRNLTAVVADGSLEHREPTARRPQGDPAHLAGNHRLLLVE
jgi:hypothetical protein